MLEIIIMIIFVMLIRRYQNVLVLAARNILYLLTLGAVYYLIQFLIKSKFNIVIVVINNHWHNNTYIE